MPISKTQSRLQSNILSQYKLTGRIHKDVKIILGEKEQIDTREKALAILEYNKQAKVLYTDDNMQLPLLCRRAQSKLNGEESLRTKVENFVNNTLIPKGQEFLAYIFGSQNTGAKTQASL